MCIVLLLETSKSLNRIHHHLAVVNQHAKFKCYDLNFKLKNKLNLTYRKTDLSALVLHAACHVVRVTVSWDLS